MSESPRDSVLVVRDLARDFVLSRAARVTALDGVSFDVRRGELVCLVGPNGAGKTTSLRIIAGLLPPTRGDVAIFDAPPGDPVLAGRVGFLPETPALFSFLTAREHLEYFSRLLASKESGRAALDDGAIARMLDRVGLARASDRRASGYSRGMKVRLGIAVALACDPALLLLDEPFSGIDPLGRVAIRELFAGLRAEGSTILLSTHDLQEAARLADRIALMVRARIRRFGTLRELAAERSLEEVFLAEAREVDEGESRS